MENTLFLEKRDPVNRNNQLKNSLKKAVLSYRVIIGPF